MSGDVQVTVSPDKMAAFVVLYGRALMSAAQLEELLCEKGVTFGISRRALSRALRGERGVRHQVAWGISKRGACGSGMAMPDQPVFRFSGSEGRPAEVWHPDSGFREKWEKLIDRGIVAKGSVLASIGDSESLPVRITVTGEKVPVRNCGEVFKPGRNTKVSSSGMELLAAASGIPYIDEEGIGVLDHVVIQGNVSKVTGDIHFPGDLTVGGDLESGFRVSVWGNMIIVGSIYGHAVSRGSVVVQGGINAPGSPLESAGHVSCRFCENSVIRARGSIRVLESSVHSVLESEETVVIGDGQGRIAGGLTRATAGVQAGVVGTEMEIPTVVEVGISPRLRRERIRLEKELARVSQDLDKLLRGRTRPGMQANTGYDGLRLERARRLLKSRLDGLTGQVESLDDRFRGMSGGYFRAGLVLPGTRVVLGLNEVKFLYPESGVALGVRASESH